MKGKQRNNNNTTSVQPMSESKVGLKKEKIWEEGNEQDVRIDFIILIA